MTSVNQGAVGRAGLAAMSMDSRQRNAGQLDAVPRPQWSIEMEECWKACREQLERRVEAAGRQ
jgi:hypothetical protein